MSAHGTKDIQQANLRSVRVARAALERVVLSVAVLCALAFAFPQKSVFAQDASSSSTTATGTALPSAPASNGAAPLGGGGGMADFSSLMMLIEQVIDPDGWLAAGGKSTQIPYFNGVYVDPRGHVRRMKEGGALPNALSAVSGQNLLQKWRAGKGMRTISLKQLDAALTDMVSAGLQPNSQMQYLAGISRIQYVVVDIANEDVLIAGPATKGEAGSGGFLLEDLITLARLVSRKTVPLGCSIDPTSEGLLRASHLLSDPATIGRLSRNPKVVAEQLKSAVGPQSIAVFGLEPSSSTAVALVDVDEHMKRVGLGLVKTTPRIKTYFDHLNAQSSVPNQSLIRWWFSYGAEPVAANSGGDAFEFPARTVQVLSQQQWIDQQGGRQPTGTADPASDAFAKEMSEQLSELRIMHPAYARLHGVYELGLALQLAVDASKQESLATWLPAICHSPYLAPEPVASPKTVDGLTTWHRLRSGTVVAVISGGVEVNSARIAAKSNWSRSSSVVKLAVKPVEALTSVGSKNWWQD